MFLRKPSLVMILIFLPLVTISSLAFWLLIAFDPIFPFLLASPVSLHLLLFAYFRPFTLCDVLSQIAVTFPLDRRSSYLLFILIWLRRSLLLPFYFSYYLMISMMLYDSLSSFSSLKFLPTPDDDFRYFLFRLLI